MRVARRDILTEPELPSESVRPSRSSVLPESTQNIPTAPPPEITPSPVELITSSNPLGLIVSVNVIVCGPISMHLSPAALAALLNSVNPLPVYAVQA